MSAPAQRAASRTPATCATRPPGSLGAAFIALSGLSQIYSAGTVDQWPENLVCALLYGGMWAIPVPDVDRTQRLLVLGADPAASQGSLLAAPDAS